MTHQDGQRAFSGTITMISQGGRRQGSGGRGCGLGCGRDDFGVRVSFSRRGCCEKSKRRKKERKEKSALLAPSSVWAWFFFDHLLWDGKLENRLAVAMDFQSWLFPIFGKLASLHETK